jgi:hypothetical protein
MLALIYRKSTTNPAVIPTAATRPPKMLFNPATSPTPALVKLLLLAAVVVPVTLADEVAVPIPEPDEPVTVEVTVEDAVLEPLSSLSIESSPP